MRRREFIAFLSDPAAAFEHRQNRREIVYEAPHDTK